MKNVAEAFTSEFNGAVRLMYAAAQELPDDEKIEVTARQLGLIIRMAMPQLPTAHSETGASFPLVPASELRNSGIIQEANRQFFHPLGLSLTLFKESDEGDEGLQVMGLSSDNDPEGSWFGPAESKAHADERLQKWEKVRFEWLKRQKLRPQFHGSIEPISSLIEVREVKVVSMQGRESGSE